MEPKSDVLATLEAKARRTSIEELKQRGRRSVRVIKASDIKRLIEQAVERAVAGSDYLSRKEVDDLIDKAQSEFEELKREREAEHEAAARHAKEVEALRAEIAKRDEELEELRRRLDQGAGSTSGGDPASSALMMKMMEELLTLKGQVGGGEPEGGGGTDAIAAKIESIASALDEKLERFGKKMGVSTAVETEVDFDGLVSRTVEDSDKLESNLDNVEVEKRTGAGIAGNLARMKKLRGGE